MSEQQINRSFQRQNPLLNLVPCQNHTPAPEPPPDLSMHCRTPGGLQQRSRRSFGMMLGSVGLLLLLLAAQAAGSEDGRLDLEQNSSHLVHLLKVSSTSRTSVLDLSRRRSRRSVFLHSGVRICPQESIEDVFRSHRAYYQLRVCQEAVWEAFRIFLDRIPGSVEYQRWVHVCQQESLCVSDIAKNFSSSEEHVGLVHTRMSQLRDRRPPTRLETPAQLHREDVELAPPPHPPPASHRPAVDLTEPSEDLVLQEIQASDQQQQDTKLPNMVPESPDPNMVPEIPVEQIVEFSIDLVDLGYRSPQSIDLAQHLQDQMLHVLHKLPGLKAIRVVGISASESQDTNRPGGVSVRFSLVFERTVPATAEPEASVDTGLRALVTEALLEDSSLTLDVDSLSFQPAELMVPSASTASSEDELDESSEPDSHNEFDVVVPVPETKDPRLLVPLAPKEKENALVTLLDSASDLETMTVTDGATSSDRPPPSEDITDESEAVYVTEPEPSDREQQEEEMLIIKHEIKNIHLNETSELMHSYVLTPPVMLQVETEAPSITLSPNLISEEDLTPADDETGSPLSVVLFTPTDPTLFTTRKEPSGVELLGLSDQTSTETRSNLQEDEDINALPDNGRADLAMSEPHGPSDVLEIESKDPTEFETGGEIIELEKDSEDETDEVQQVLQLKPDAAEDSESMEEPAEVSKPMVKTVEGLAKDEDLSKGLRPGGKSEDQVLTLEKDEAKDSETEKEMIESSVVEASNQDREETEVSTPLEESVTEGQEKVTAVESEEAVLDSGPERETEVNEPAEISEPEESPSTIEPEGATAEVFTGAQEERDPDVELTATKAKDEEEVTEKDVAVSEQEVSKLHGAECEKISEGAASEVSQEPLAERIPKVSEEMVSELTKETVPKVSEKNAPNSSEEDLPKVLEESQSDITDEPLASITKETDHGSEDLSKLGEVVDKKASEPEEPVPVMSGSEEEDEKRPTNEGKPSAEEKVVEFLTQEDEVPKPTLEPGEDLDSKEVPGATTPSERDVSVHQPEPAQTSPLEKESHESQEKPEEDVLQALASELGKESLYLPEIPHPEIEDAERAEPEEEKAVYLPNGRPMDFSKPDLPPRVEEEIKELSKSPEGASEQDKGKVDFFPPASGLPETSGSKSLEEVGAEDGEGADVSEKLPTGKNIDVLDTKPEKDVTDPPAVSIKILHPVDTMEGLHFEGGAAEVLEDELHPGVSQDYYSLQEKNVHIRPAQPFDEGTSDLNSAVIDGIHVEEKGEGLDTQVEMDSGAVPEVMTAEDNVPSEGPRTTDEPLLEKEDIEGVVITERPVSEDFPRPPAAGVEFKTTSPGPTLDSGLLEVAEDSTIPSAAESVEEDSTESVHVFAEDASPPVATEEAVQDLLDKLDQTSITPTEASELPDSGSGFTSAGGSTGFTAPPSLRYLTTPSMTTAIHGRELVVFFSLRLTNMDFSDELFNKTSSEYRSLENTLLDVLLPYLQANLTGFKNLEILNFRRGSVVVNSRMRFTKTVPYNVTEAVRCILDRFCSSTAEKLRIHIDRHSLDIEPADRADPCKFLACGTSSRCEVNSRTKEARCRCDPGLQSHNQQNFCEPDPCPGGACLILPGGGDKCRNGSILPDPSR